MHSTGRDLTRLARGVVVSVVAFVLTGCGGAVLKKDYEDFAASYADSSNGQMLMNLARRDQGHPPYFLQLASISSSHQHSATFGTSFTRSDTGTRPTITEQLTKSLTPSLSLSSVDTPTFGFAPLAGKSFANALLSPIGANVFFSLLGQGVSADQLLRTMTQKVTFEWASGERLHLRNVPDEERLDSFRNFLRFAGLMREMQKQGLFDVTAKGMKFNGGMEGMFALIASDPDRYNFLEGVHTKRTKGRPKVEFSFRTFDALLTAMATEQAVFDYLVARHKDDFLDKIPASQTQPILRTKWAGVKSATSKPVVAATYRGTKYEIKDLVVDDPSTSWRERERWNRDSFHLLTEMFSVISLDPSQLPAQQLIQVR